MKPVVVIVGIEYPENLGLICRAMKNFGSSELLLVGPTIDVDSGQSRSRAMHAQDILKKAKVFSSLEKALEKVDYSIATTAKKGSGKKMKRTLLSPSTLAEQFSGSNGKLGIVLGRESAGLTNEEIRACDFIVNIPTSRVYRTLNISHACAVLLYSLYSHNKKTGLKPAATKTKKILETKFSSVIGGAKTIENKKSVLSASKALISRSLITEKEAKALLALLQEIERKK